MTTESKAHPATAADPSANGQPAKVKVTEGKAAGEPCEDCQPSPGATGLGLLLCAVAGGLLYMGLDLIFGISGRLARPAEGDVDAS